MRLLAASNWNSPTSRFGFAGLCLLLLTLFPVMALAQFTTVSDGQGGLTISGYTGPGGAVVIPGTINGLKVTGIGSEAFAFTKVTDVTIPSGVTSIGDQGFFDCTSLTTITIPSSVTRIGTYAFSACDHLTTGAIPPGVTTIGSYAYAGCHGLTNVSIPASVSDLESPVFYDCDNLTSYAVDPGNAFYSSKNGVLFDKTQTTLVAYPTGKAGTYAIPNGVTTIEESAFYNCIDLTGITIPDTVTSTGIRAFASCTSLTNLALPSSLPSLADYVFKDCTGLGIVTIPPGVTAIGYSAFNGCTSLTSVTIPASVKTIDSYAFSYCPGLTTALFNGNAPTMGLLVFSEDASNFTVIYRDKTTGFTTPTWKDSSGYVWQTIKVNKLPQAINFPSVTGVPFGVKYTLQATTTGGLPVTYSLISGPAILSGKQLTFNGTGVVTIKASQAGNSNYAPAQDVTSTLTVVKGTQTLSFPAIPQQTWPVSTITLAAKASSGLPIIYSASGAATVSGNVLTITKPGTVKVTARQVGNANYLAAPPVTIHFTVAKTAQTITFPPVGKVSVGQKVTLAATSTSGLPLTYTTSFNTVIISGNTATFTAAGTFKLTATQPGDETYNAAKAVSINVSVK